MNLFFCRLLAFIAISLLVATQLLALTQMVTAKIEFPQSTISPDGLKRAHMVAIDMESTLMDRLFDGGHITFNSPAEIQLAGAENVLSPVENLLFQTKKGGANLLVLCKVRLREPQPNQALVVESCAISAIPVYVAADFPLTWIMPVGPDLRDTDLKKSLQVIARLLLGKLDGLPGGEVKLSLGS